ncbi:SPOR domain-containing protein [Halomonas sp. Bachu 37]|uniref:SPOR domain-containing protein n=1 Tax=Halomonas kashgarensis TaxID=3084920 RepID=UPI003217613B
MTERVSGIVILLAVLAITIPWLMSDPAPREDRPQPNFTIQQPIEVDRRDVPEPTMPDSVRDGLSEEERGQSSFDQDVAVNIPSIDAMPREPQVDETAESEAPSASPESQRQGEPDAVEQPASPASDDPIADVIAASQSESQETASSNTASSPSTAAAADGEWTVQVGSFGEAANAQRLSEQLEEQGFSVYQRPRDNNLTTVYVGPFATAEQGESAMLEVKQRVNVQGLLVRVRD